MTVADKLCVEARCAPRMPLRRRRRMCRAHDPSRLRRRRRRSGRKPQQKRGDAGGLGCERQLAACHEIELPRPAPDLQHHGAQRIAGERIRRRPQRAVGIGRAYRDQAARVEAEFAEAAHRQRACFDLAEILPHPDERPPRRDSRRKAGNKSGRNRALPAGFRKHLMHGAPRKTAGKRRVGFRMTECHAIRRERAAMRLDAGKVAAQSRKRAHACARHAPLPFTDAGRR